MLGRIGGGVEVLLLEQEHRVELELDGDVVALEEVDGPEVAALHASLGRRELDESIARFADRPALTRLRTHLAGVDPDDGYSMVPYEKGYFFLCAIEAAVGRPAFEAWLKRYLADFRFGAITTDDFCAHLEAALPGALAAVDAPANTVPPATSHHGTVPGSSRSIVAGSIATSRVGIASATQSF